MIDFDPKKKISKPLLLPYLGNPETAKNCVQISCHIVPPEKQTHKISLDVKIDICKMLATGFSCAVISQNLWDRFGVKVSKECIRNTYLRGKKWKDRIERFKRALDKSVLKHPAASKRVRIDILMYTINEALKWTESKIVYDKNGNEIERIEKRQLGAVATLIRELRTEIEGDTPLVDNSTHYHYTKVKDDDLINKAREAGIKLPAGIEQRIAEAVPVKQDKVVHAKR